MPSHPAFHIRTLAVVAAASLALSGTASATFLDIQLTFGTLPSAQGWTYVASGAHAGVPEGNIFSVAGSVLTQNSMGQSNGISGGSIFYQMSPGVTTTDPKQIRVTARCLQVEGSANALSGEGGFIFGFATGSVQYAFGLTPTRISVLQPGGTVLATGTFDNSTAFHDYIFDWQSASLFRIYRDGVLVYTGSGGFSVAANRVFLGDGTGGANAHGEITAFRFLQDYVTPATTTTWGRLRGLYR